MPFFTLQTKSDGPIVEAVIGVSEGLREALDKAGKPVPPAVRIRGLIDTGAGCTCVDARIFTELSLTRKGTVLLGTPSTGETQYETDEFDVSFKMHGAGLEQE